MCELSVIILYYYYRHERTISILNPTLAFHNAVAHNAVANLGELELVGGIQAVCVSGLQSHSTAVNRTVTCERGKGGEGRENRRTEEKQKDECKTGTHPQTEKPITALTNSTDHLQPPHPLG